MSLSKFYIRRAFRILPPLYITLAFATALSFVYGRGHQGNMLGWFSVLGWVFNYALLIAKNHVDLPIGLGIVWSLMIEEHFYLLFPAYLKASIRYGWTRVKQTRVLIAICIMSLVWRYVLVLHFKALLQPPFWTYMATDAIL